MATWHEVAITHSALAPTHSGAHETSGLCTCGHKGVKAGTQATRVLTVCLNVRGDDIRSVGRLALSRERGNKQRWIGLSAPCRGDGISK